MLVSSKLTADSYQLCLHVCVTNKTLVSIDLLLFRFFFLFLREQIFFSYFSQILQQQKNESLSSGSGVLQQSATLW